jgi:alginate O-acetyltransferase complex protein AlgI
MYFNSTYFALFLIIVFILYWLPTNKNARYQNSILFISSYFFYAFWDWRFLFLLAFSTLLDFYTGIKIAESQNSKTKKLWLWLSITINLSLLGVFKYYNFFANSFSELLSHFGLHTNPYTLQLILPLGISFYTFHGLSYVIDIYKNKIKAEKSIVDYSVFVSFFPLLIAGPIERATHLLPQLKIKRTFDYGKTVDGLRQILWGLFKKVVIADQCAEYANVIFGTPDYFSGSTLLLGAIFFSFQIYGDFSSYSDIAIGSAKLLGINLLRNFSFPYFSRSVAEFWRRWHISLTSWFRDYIYIPLGGSQYGTWTTIRNTFFIFLISGFWHGANWTFIAWGLLNAIYILPSILFNKNRNYLNTVAEGRTFPSLKELTSIGFTFLLVSISWIFFRSNNIAQALEYIVSMSTNIFSKQAYADTLYFIFWKDHFRTSLLILFFIWIEWIGRREQYALSKIGLSWPITFRWGFYYLLIIAIHYFSGAQQHFIYFQF